jgi:hypothetical protein
VVLLLVGDFVGNHSNRSGVAKQGREFPPPWLYKTDSKRELSARQTCKRSDLFFRHMQGKVVKSITELNRKRRPRPID